MRQHFFTEYPFRSVAPFPRMAMCMADLRVSLDSGSSNADIVANPVTRCFGRLVGSRANRGGNEESRHPPQPEVTMSAHAVMRSGICLAVLLVGCGPGRPALPDILVPPRLDLRHFGRIGKVDQDWHRRVDFERCEHLHRCDNRERGNSQHPKRNWPWDHRQRNKCHQRRDSANSGRHYSRRGNPDIKWKWRERSEWCARERERNE